MMKTKKKGSIFRMLVISYIVFAMILIFSFLGTLVLSLLLISDNDLSSLKIYTLTETPNQEQVRTVENLGGWIEGLDKNYQVIEVLGNKANNKKGYSQEEIYQFLSISNPEEPINQNYYGFIGVNNESASLVTYWMTFLPSNAVTPQIAIRVSNTNTPYFYLCLLFFAFLFILNCILLSLFLSKKIKHPLQKIQLGMDQIQEGNPNIQLDFDAKMEFLEIKNSFNYMSSAIEKEKQARIDSEERKNQLLLDLSHDIKTPISTIKAYTRALDEKIVPEESIDLYLEVIEKKAMRVSELSSDLFTVLSMENASYLLHKEPILITEFLREICLEFYEEALEKDFSMEIDIPESHLIIKIDPKLFCRVIENLISNAIKYNKTGSIISISLFPQGSTLVIEVGDDGERIPLEQENFLFDAFSRGDKARSSDGGTGLGLFISKTIIEKHDGNIGYRRVTGRNIFYLSLPNLK